MTQSEFTGKTTDKMAEAEMGHFKWRLWLDENGVSWSDWLASDWSNCALLEFVLWIYNKRGGPSHKWIFNWGLLDRFPGKFFLISPNLFNITYFYPYFASSLPSFTPVHFYHCPFLPFPRVKNKARVKFLPSFYLTHKCTTRI